MWQGLSVTRRLGDSWPRLYFTWWNVHMANLPSEGWCHTAVRALDPVRHLEGYRKPIQNTDMALGPDWQPDDLITESQHYISAKWQRRGSNPHSLEKRHESVLYISALWSDKVLEHKYLSISAWNRLQGVYTLPQCYPDSKCVIAGLRTVGHDEVINLYITLAEND